MKRSSTLVMALVVAIAGALVAGCSDRSSSSRGPGIVGQVTGDPDDEVSPQLQQQVGLALSRGENDDPVDF